MLRAHAAAYKAIRALPGAVPCMSHCHQHMTVPLVEGGFHRPCIWCTCMQSAAIPCCQFPEGIGLSHWNTAAACRYQNISAHCQLSRASLLFCEGHWHGTHHVSFCAFCPLQHVLCRVPGRASCHAHSPCSDRSHASPTVLIQCGCSSIFHGECMWCMLCRWSRHRDWAHSQCVLDRAQGPRLALCTRKVVSLRKSICLTHRIALLMTDIVYTAAYAQSAKTSTSLHPPFLPWSRCTSIASPSCAIRNIWVV